ncbi:MAG: hypothetical protein ABSB69_01805 [Solirubrobacteraceae bacterium]
MPGPGAPDQAELEAAEGKVREILQAGEGRESPALPRDLQHLPEKRAAQELERARQEVETKRERDKQEIELRRTYANGLLRILTGQLVIADLVFVVFAWAGKDWNLSTAVIDTWLGAVVVQVVGVVLVVTRHLFPQRDSKP